MTEAESAASSRQPAARQSVLLVCNNDNSRDTIRRVLEGLGAFSVTHTRILDRGSSKPEDVEKVTSHDRLILVVHNELDYRQIEYCKQILQRAEEDFKCVLVVEEEPLAAGRLFKKQGQDTDNAQATQTDNAIHKGVKRTDLQHIETGLKSWFKRDQLFIMTVGDTTASEDQSKCFDSLTDSLLHSGYRLRLRKRNNLEWNDISDNMAACDKVIAVYYKPPGKIPSHARGHLYQMAFDKMIAQRKPVMCIVKMYALSDSSGDDDVLKNHRIKQFVKIVDYDNPEEIPSAIDSWLTGEATQQIGKNMVFGSLGNGLAWQYATGFLAYILPNIGTVLKQQVLDENGLVKREILEDFHLSHLDPKQIFVIKKYFVFLKEDDIDRDDHVIPNPPEIFFNCRRIERRRTSADVNAGDTVSTGCREENLQSSKLKTLTLSFESPGYAKAIPLYLCELDNKVSLDASESYTHVIILGGFAPPVSVIRDLRGTSDLGVSEETLHSAYKLFHDELQFILNHPKANQLLAKFGSVEIFEEVNWLEKAACIVEWKKGEEDEKWKLICLSRIKEEILSDRVNEPIRSQVKNVVKSDILVLKFSKSAENIHVEVSTKLAEQGFTVKNFELLTKTFAQVLVSCGKMVLFATLNDLEKLNSEYNSSDYKDQDHNNLLRDITSAVTYIHMRQEYNLVVVVISDDAKKDIYSALPSSLKILPENNIISIVDRTAGLSNFSSSFPEIINRLELRNSAIKVEENLPLMSMAYAMAANSCFGFVHHFVKHSSFPLPYKYVVPRSARYPDPGRLHAKLSQLGVQYEKVKFESDGRTYELGFYSWHTVDAQKKTVAFEVPPCVLNLRKQAKCGLGGVRRTKLKQNLDEYIMAFRTMLDCMGWQDKVQVLEWKDEVFPGDAWHKPTQEYAASLRDLVFSGGEGSLQRTVSNLHMESETE